MSYLNANQYNAIMRVLNPIFYLFLGLFFLKEFSLLFLWGLFTESIADWVFLITFMIYALFYITPMFKPELVEGYQIPKFDTKDDESIELTDEERELKELEKISL